MGSRGLSEEEFEFAKRAGLATAETRVGLAEAAAAYAELEPSFGPLDADGRAVAQEWVERIAEVWRVAEQASITHAEVAEQLSTERPHLLLGAIQDSLILLAAGAERGSELLLDVAELARRIEELREDGAFDDAPIKPRPFPAVREPDAKAYQALTDDLIDVVGDGSVFIARVARQGDSLEGLESEARSLVHRLASVGRRAEFDYPLLLSGEGPFDPRLVLVLHRSMVQALVLRLSSDPARRELAIPIPDLGSRVAWVQEHLEQTWL